MNEKSIADYIKEVFEPGGHFVEIFNKGTLTFEEAELLMKAYAKDHRGWSWGGI